MSYPKLNCIKIQLEFDTIIANFQAASISIKFCVRNVSAENEFVAK